MADVAASSLTYLALGELDTDPRLARRLPAELARRLHALPVAEDGEQITVAMADPADQGAREALTAALGRAACVVRADQTTIDLRLSEIWPSEPERPLALAVCTLAPAQAGLAVYAQALAAHLGGSVQPMATPRDPQAMARPEGMPDGDLIFFDDAQHPWIRRVLACLRAAEADAPRALVVAEEPRWPIRRILVVLTGDDGDTGAIDWAEHIARPGDTTVTVLAVVPPVPAMYRGCARMEQGLPALLSSATPLGCQTRRATRKLVQSGIDCVLRLREGAPDWEVAREVTGGDYDLVIVSSMPSPWWRRWLEGDLVGTLLRVAGRPLLVARPAAT